MSLEFSIKLETFQAYDPSEKFSWKHKLLTWKMVGYLFVCCKRAIPLSKLSTRVSRTSSSWEARGTSF